MRLKHLILLLFILLVFGCISLSVKSSCFAAEDRDIWYKEHDWLMLKQEKDEWKTLKTQEMKESFIERFYAAREPDTFTYKNEFKLFYQANLEKVRKDYPDFSDPRRYIYLLYGEPSIKQLFRDQLIQLSIPVVARIRIQQAEIWRYSSGQKKFQVIFVPFNYLRLQHFRDSFRDRDSLRDQQIDIDNILLDTYLFAGSKYEILYIGPDLYPDISRFLEDFLSKDLRPPTTSDILDNLKKPILQRAENFYKNPKPELQKRKYSNEWKSGIQIYIEQFEINSPEEVGIAFWIFFKENSLSYNTKKKQYSADITLYCEIQDVNGRQVVYYYDQVSYKLKKPKAYYYFWGSLPAGNYKLILELGDNKEKKYRKIEQSIEVFDYSKPVLTAKLLIGKIVDEKEENEMVKGKPRYFSLKEGKFYLAFNNEQFRDNDEMVVILDILGFQKNLYGNLDVELSLLFVKGGLRNSRFVPTGEVYLYRFQPIEKDMNRIHGVIRLKIKEIVEVLKISSGLYQIQLQIQDKVANQGGVKNYPYLIFILSARRVKKQ